MKCLNCGIKFKPTKFLQKFCNNDSCKTAEYNYKKGNVTYTKSKKINTFSNKMLIEQSKYRVLRDEYMNSHTKCEFHNCHNPSNDLHHKAKRGKNLCNVSTFMAVCRKHHIWIHDNEIESKRMGYLIKKN